MKAQVKDLFDVLFYVKINGEMPAHCFMMSLNVKMRAKITDAIVLLRDNGYRLRKPYSEYLSDGIFELRVKQGSNIVRVLFFFDSEKRIILTNGFLKKTQKTPANEVHKAKEYMKDYLNRKGDLTV